MIKFLCSPITPKSKTKHGQQSNPISTPNQSKTKIHSISKSISYAVDRVPSEPNSREMTPAELRLDDISSLLEGIAHSNRMIPASPVVLGPLVLRSAVTALASGIFLLHSGRVRIWLRDPIPGGRVWLDHAPIFGRGERARVWPLIFRRLSLPLFLFSFFKAARDWRRRERE